MSDPPARRAASPCDISGSTRWDVPTQAWVPIDRARPEPITITAAELDAMSPEQALSDDREAYAAGRLAYDPDAPEKTEDDYEPIPEGESYWKDVVLPRWKLQRDLERGTMTRAQLVAVARLLRLARRRLQRDGDATPPEDYLSRMVLDWSRWARGEGAVPARDAVPLSAVPTEEPKPLLLGYLDPDDHTILFGDGGVGKGIVAAWLVARLSLDRPVLLLDYERHARWEWRPRVERFGGDLDNVFITQPERPIWDATEDVLNEVARFGAEYVVVDSVGYACVGQEVEKSATAIRYSEAVSRIALPTLSLAHTTKADADPRHPFGSVFWSNGARVTIGMAGEGDARVLTNKKTNQRAAFAPVAIDWTWTDEGLPPTLVERRLQLTLADRAYVALSPNLALTLEEIAAAVNADGGQPTTWESVGKAVRRDAARFTNDGARPARWKRAIVVNRVPQTER